MTIDEQAFDSNVQERILPNKGMISSVAESYFIHLVLIALLIMLAVNKGEGNTLGIAITACVVVIAVGTDNISRFSFGPKGIEFERVKDLTQKNSEIISRFVFMSMPDDIFKNLGKIVNQEFGDFVADDNFKRQLRYLLNNGFIVEKTKIENIPLQGIELSDHLSPTQTGIDFVAIRDHLRLDGSVLRI